MTVKRPDSTQLERARDAFLNALEATGNISEASRATTLYKRRFYEMRDADPEFAKAWEERLEIAYDRMEREAWRRAVEGWDEPVYQQGRLVGHVKRHSDKLLEVLLRGNRPTKFRAPMVELSGERTVLHAHFHHAAPMAERVIEQERPAAITHQDQPERALDGHRPAEGRDAAELDAMNASPRGSRIGGGNE